MKKLILGCSAVLALVACGPNKSQTPPANDTLKTTEPTNQTETLEERPSPLKRTTGTIGDMKIVIGYGSPGVKNRQIWGSLVPYNEVWRSGANEATNIEFTKDVLINDKPLPAGKYGFFTIPTEGEWTLIFNSVWDQWGAYDYDASKDVLRITVKPEQNSAFAERLDYTIEKDGVALVWEKLKVQFTVKVK